MVATNRQGNQRTTTATEKLTVAVHIEATDERTPAWEAIWRELLLKPRGDSASPCPAPPPLPPPPPAAPPSAPAPKEGGDVA